MNVQKEKKMRAFIFRVVFSLETGGGHVEVEAKNRVEALNLLTKNDPNVYDKVKTVKKVGEC